METLQTPTKPASRPSRITLLIGLLAVLAPLGYLAGRLSAATLAGTYFAFLGSGFALGSIGAMIGIPVGLFFGSLRPQVAAEPVTSAEPIPTHANTAEMEHDILTELRRELAENRSLFEARQGSTTMFARIAYITPFWTSIKASGRLFVMQDAQLLNSISTAYYWLDQATHLETLAYQAKYASDAPDSPAIAAHLIAEARLLDGQLGKTLTAAISAIDAALAPATI